MNEEEKTQIFNDTLQRTPVLPDLKNEAASSQTTPRHASTERKNSAKFDPISITSFEYSDRNDLRRPTKSRPSERVSKLSTRSTPVSAKRRKKEENRPSDSEIQASFDAFVNDGETPPIEMKEYVIQLINREKVKSLLLGQYSVAKNYDNIKKELNDSYKQEAIYMTRTLKNDEINEKRAEYQQLWEEENSRWDLRVQQQLQDNEEYNESLAKRQEEELQAFRERWQTPEFIETFNKPSNLLLNLRYKETKLALMKNYDEAEKIRVYANKQQKIEEEKMKENMEIQMRKEFTSIKTRHTEEIENAKRHQAKTLETIEFQRQRALKTFETTDKPLPISKIPITIISRDSGAQSALQTPRTASNLANFRSQRHAKLNLAPMEDSDFQKLEEKPSSQVQSRMRSPAKSTPIRNRNSRRLLPAL